MSKPIFLVGLPESTPRKEYSTISELLENKLGKDYYVLIYPNLSSNSEIKFDLKHVSDIDDVKFEELKILVKNSVNEHIKKGNR